MGGSFLDRRSFLGQCFAMGASYSVMRMAMGTGCLATEGRDLMNTWFKDLVDLCGDLRTSRISPELWQEQMAILYRGIDPNDLMGFIDFPNLVERLSWPETGAAIAQVKFPEIEGMPAPRGFGRKIFALEKGRAVVPHAHNNMVSAHFILQGEFHVRTYNRRFDLEEGNGYLMVEPSLDTVFGPGDLLTMSDTRDNVHWLVAETETAFTFDIPMTDLFDDHTYATPANKYSMIFIDPPASSDSNDPQPAKVIDVAQALARFG